MKTLVEKLKEYIEFLDQEVDKHAMFLRIYHIYTPDEIVKKGERLRAEITSLEQSEKPAESAKQYFMQKCGITELEDIYTLHYSELFKWMEEYASLPKPEKEYFEKVYIKSVDDFPEDGEYFCNRNGFMTVQNLTKKLPDK
jgi:hypothetical protein